MDSLFYPEHSAPLKGDVDVVTALPSLSFQIESSTGVSYTINGETPTTAQSGQHECEEEGEEAVHKERKDVIDGQEREVVTAGQERGEVNEDEHIGHLVGATSSSFNGFLQPTEEEVSRC